YPREGLAARLLHLQLDRVPVLRRLDLELVDRLTGRTALLDLHEDVGLVPRLNLNRAVEGRHAQRRRARDGKAFFLANDLTLGIDGHGATGGQESRNHDGAGEPSELHTGDRRRERGGRSFYSGIP